MDDTLVRTNTKKLKSCPELFIRQKPWVSFCVILAVLMKIFLSYGFRINLDAIHHAYKEKLNNQ